MGIFRQLILVPTKESIGLFFLLFFCFAVVVIARKEIKYQKNKFKIDGSESERLFFAEQLIKRWFYRQRFLCDVKKDRITLKKDFSLKQYDELTVSYRTHPTPKNLEKASQVLMEYLE